MRLSLFQSCGLLKSCGKLKILYSDIYHTIFRLSIYHKTDIQIDSQNTLERIDFGFVLKTN